jgi:hypothetical protein
MNGPPVPANDSGGPILDSSTPTPEASTPTGDASTEAGEGGTEGGSSSTSSGSGCTTAAAQWLFEDGSGTIAADSSGHGNALSLMGTTWTTGHDGGSGLAFDGSTSYATVAYNASFQATVQIAVTAWLNPANNPFGTLVAKSMIGGPIQDWGFYVTDGELDALFNWPSSGAGSDGIPSSGAMIASGTWVFVAIVLDVNVGTVSFYTNGTLVSSAPWTSPLLQNDAVPITVGVDAATPNFYMGVMNDLAVWTRPLSAADIAAIYAGGCPS